MTYFIMSLSLIFKIFLINLLIFIENMIYFNKLIDFYINRQESQKVVDNYFVGTKTSFFQTLYNALYNLISRL